MRLRAWWMSWYSYFLWGSGLYELKSWFFRLLEPKNQRKPVPAYPSLRAIARQLKPDWWTADSWTVGWDAVSSPEHVEWTWQTGTKPSRNFDCDEFAVYNVKAVENSLAAGTLTENISCAYLMAVMWMEENGKISGHHVCLLEVSGGSSGYYEYMFMDYIEPTARYKSILDVAMAITANYTKGAGQLLFYAIQTSDVKLLDAVRL